MEHVWVGTAFAKSATMQHLVRILALPLLGSLIACGGQRPDDLRKNPTGTTRHATVALRASLGSENIDVTGVTVDPITKKRYVLDARAGIYEMDGDQATLVSPLHEMVGDGVFPMSDFTDFVALGNGRFALTAVNDGFLLDTNTKTFSSYFCYVPGDIIDPEAPIPVQQLTRSVTFDPTRNKLFAQPQTFREGLQGPPESAEVGRFDIEGGEGYGWIDLNDPEFSAGGIAVEADGTMLLGADEALYRLDLETGDLREAYDLSSLQIGTISGLAVDGERVLVIDAARQELVEITID